MTIATRQAFHVRPDGGPCCALCGKLPASPDLERAAMERGTSAELGVYAVTVDAFGGIGAVLWIGWVCTGDVHGNLSDSNAEGRRIGWRSR